SAADRAQAPDPVNQLKGYPLESNSEEPSQGTGPRRGHPVNRVRGKGRDVMARLHILRVRAEAKQLRIWLAPQNLFDDRLQRTFVAEVAGAEVSVKADFCGFHGFRGSIKHVANSPCFPSWSNCRLLKNSSRYKTLQI